MSETLNSKDKDEHVIFCMLYQLYVDFICTYQLYCMQNLPSIFTRILKLKCVNLPLKCVCV